MKSSRMTLALFGALCAFLLSFLCAGKSHAQASANDGQKVVPQGMVICIVNGADTTCRVWKGTTDGVPYFTDADRDRDKVATWDLMQGTNLAQGAADSTNGCYDVHAYRYLKLLLKITPRTGANTVTRVAFQFRECLNDVDNDTTSVYPEYLYGQSQQGVSATLPDTTISGHIFTGSASTAWSGEYIVTINENRSSPGNGASAVAFSYPNGLSIPLDSFFGRPCRFRYLSVRMRNLGPGAGSTPAIDYTVKLIGFAQ